MSEEITPNDPVADTELPIATTADIEFEKFKLKMNFYKWMLGTFVITIITITINWGFKDREQGIAELQVYDKYASESVVFAENPKNRLLLAQFFANVTPSDKLKKGWKEYLEVVKTDVDSFNSKIKQNQLLVAKLAKDAENSSMAMEKYIKAKEISDELNRIDNIKLVDEKAPTITFKKTSKNVRSIDSAKDFELKGFEAILSKDISSAIYNFKMSENSYNGYNSVFEIAKYLENTNFSNTPKNWTNIYKDILNKYSWGMPNDIKQKLTDASK